MEQKNKLSKGKRTQLKILNAAKGLFLSQGYTATSMRQIAQVVEITPAAIYNHFSGKEELFIKLLDEVAPYDEMTALFHTAQGETPEEIIRNLFHKMLDLFFQREDYFKLAVIDIFEREGKTYRRFLQRVFPIALGFHQQLIESDQGQNQLRGIFPPIFLRAFVSLIIGYVLTEWVAKPMETLSLPEIDWHQALSDIFMHGVLSPLEGGG